MSSHEIAILGSLVSVRFQGQGGGIDGRSLVGQIVLGDRLFLVFWQGLTRDDE
jgi:hypothetical protein